MNVDVWGLILWWNDQVLTAAAACERWYRFGGPRLYHDSYTTSLFLAEYAAEHFLQCLRDAVASEGGHIEQIVGTQDKRAV